MEAPQVLRTDSQLLSEQFSVPLKTARQTLNSCNNDLAKAGKKLLQSLMTQSEHIARPSTWTTKSHVPCCLLSHPLELGQVDSKQSYTCDGCNRDVSEALHCHICNLYPPNFDKVHHTVPV